jgi:protoheme ferro-lyase
VECLETLEDFGKSATRAFVGAGGLALDYIPPLGTDDLHVELVAQLVGNIAGLATRRLTAIEGKSQA